MQPIFRRVPPFLHARLFFREMAAATTVINCQCVLYNTSGGMIYIEEFQSLKSIQCGTSGRYNTKAAIFYTQNSVLDVIIIPLYKIVRDAFLRVTPKLLTSFLG